MKFMNMGVPSLQILAHRKITENEEMYPDNLVKSRLPDHHAQNIIGNRQMNRNSQLVKVTGRRNRGNVFQDAKL
jgi:hypothetical protein